MLNGGVISIEDQADAPEAVAQLVARSAHGKLPCLAEFFDAVTAPQLVDSDAVLLGHLHLDVS